MLILQDNSDSIEQALSNGKLECPSCDNGVLAKWGHGSERTLRLLSGVRTFTPRRGRCKSCKKTHVLLIDVAFLRRVDEAALIGLALILSSEGLGYKKIAHEISRPFYTVRNWIRRFKSKANEIKEFFLAIALKLDLTLDSIQSRGSPLHEALEVIGLSVRAYVLIFEKRPLWSIVSQMTSGRLLFNTK